MSVLQWILVVAAGYLALAVFLLFANGNATLIAIPFAIVYFAVEFVRRPASWRLARAVRSLRRPLATREPAIVETRVVEWERGTPTVYLVYGADSEEAAVRSQLHEIRALIESAASGWQTPADYVSAMRLWPVSRSAVDREGGWFGFDHNVSFPRSDKAGE